MENYSPPSLGYISPRKLQVKSGPCQVGLQTFDYLSQVYLTVPGLYIMM